MFRAGFQGNTLVANRSPSFTDWANDSSVRTAMEFPIQGILFDVANGVWLDAWGSRPDSVAERERIVRALVSAAPPLIPLLGHRYIATAPGAAKGYAVLSVMQTDIIEYGSDLRDYLLTELCALLGDYGQRFGASTGAAGTIPFWGAFID